MILRPLLATGLLALQATAFLVPLEVAQGHQAATVELACRGCAFVGPEQNDVEFDTADENLLQLTLSIEEMTTFKINEQTLFSLEAPVSPASLTAVQIRTSDSTSSRPVHLGYALEVLPAVSFAHDEGQIITLQFTTLALEGAPVQVDTLKIDLYRSADGLSIANVSPIPFADTPGAAECATSLCRLRAIINARVRPMLDAAKARAQSAGAWVKGGCRGGRKHGDHAYSHHSLHRFGHIMRQTLRFFIVPALLGVIGGLMASAVGMLVGHALVYLWFRFHRGGRRGNTSRLAHVAIIDDEKEALLFNDDTNMAVELPPHYNDIPTIVIEEAKE